MMDPTERTLLETTVRDALEGTTEADTVLATLGWTDMLTAEPDDAIAVVFDALGRTNAAASAIDDVVAHAAGHEPCPERAVLLPPFGMPTPDGPTGLATVRVRTATELLVRRDGRLRSVPIGDADVETVRGIDPDAGIHRVRIDADPVAPAMPGSERDGSVATAWAQRALAHQVSGATHVMLDLAREHALARVQFGRPVAQFQAVRHRLAEALVAIEALDATLAAAADAPGPLTAQLAKATAGRTARTVTGHAQQVLAGIGFTTDHPFHRYLKRTMLLDGMFGSSDDLVVAIGHRLLIARAVPTLIDL
jgi:hypothetical protein